jgi:hypothetical protein
MPRPRVSPENQALALEFACMVTTSEDAADSCIARHGPNSIYTVLSKAHPAIIRDDSSTSNRKGISKAEFLRVLADSGKFTRFRDRKAAKMSDDPTGAGMCIFRNIRWRSPTDAADQKHLREHHKRLVKSYPSFAKTTVEQLTSVLNAVIATWDGARVERTCSPFSVSCNGSPSSQTISCSSPSDYSGESDCPTPLKRKASVVSDWGGEAPPTIEVGSTSGTSTNDTGAHALPATPITNFKTIADKEFLLANHTTLARHDTTAVVIHNKGSSGRLEDGESEITTDNESLCDDSDFGFSHSAVPMGVQNFSDCTMTGGGSWQIRPLNEDEIAWFFGGLA